MSVVPAGCLALLQGGAQAMSERRACLVTEDLAAGPYGYQYRVDDADNQGQLSEVRVEGKEEAWMSSFEFSSNNSILNDTLMGE